ncbi:MAG: alcohol dehydrogenase catalytic domain-containing protein [Acidiferrobacterales bacterium]|nr:alcohol dehydrogenase catalytic domain-containing protein [Acidiferrobacterales bacterium]
MKALVYTAPNTVEYRNESNPNLVEDESLVRIDAVGICGSDLHAYLGHDSRRVPPLILGHEVCGTVIEGPAAGIKAVLNPLITCGECDDCVSGLTNLCKDRKLIGMNRPGAFAEFITIPTKNVVEVAADSDSTKLAMTEPAAVSLHAVRLVENVAARPISEGSVLVIGGGAVGLFCVYFLLDYGCKSITVAETNPDRRATIEKLGLCEVIDPLNAEHEADSFDSVLDAVGNEHTRRSSIHAVKPGGVIMHIGLGDTKGEMDVRKMTLAEVTFIGTYTYTALDFRVAARKIENGEIGSLDWVDERSLEEGSRSFQELIQGEVASPKIVLRPNQ